MPAKPKYRLEPLLRMKERALRQAEIALAKAIKEVQEEEKKLKRLEEKKKEILARREKARQEMSGKIASGQSRVMESQFHLGFIQKLKEDEEALEKEIEEQKEAVERAKGKVKRGRRDYMDSAYELNVMQKHKELWMKKERHILSVLENKQMNELGNTVHQMNRMRG